jgi:hypothetical protein
MRRVGLVLVLVATLFITPAYADSVFVDEQFGINTLVTTQQVDTQSSIGVLFEENVDTLRMPSLLHGFNFKAGGQPDAIAFCKSLEDPACAKAEYMRYYALYQPCESESDVDCIESVYAIPSNSSSKVEGKISETIPSVVSKPYKEDLKQGLPQGGNSSVWSLPNVTHKGGGDGYAVIVSRVGVLKKSSSGKFVPTDFDNKGDFRAAIYPVNIVKDSGYSANEPLINEQPEGHKGLEIGHPSTLGFESCAIVGDGSCALRQGFPEDVEFGLVIRFAKVVNGWMHGRIDTPQIDYEKTEYGTRVEMKGLATKVPVLAGWVAPSRFKSSEVKEYPWLDKEYAGRSIYPGSSGEDSMRQLTMWSRVLSDKAAANPSQWTFYNLSKFDLQGSDDCIANSKTLAGFVTTNSTTYAANPPTFNGKTQTLDYKVASAHYLADGTVFTGKYDLYIASKVARCIYGFSNAPISASVSIVSDKGESKVATTTMVEKSGWIHLAARGFTFSSPTLKVKLTQKNARSAAKTITCVKGSASKRVSGANAKCPPGFSKK